VTAILRLRDSIHLAPVTTDRERHGHICRVGVESEASDVDATFRRSKLEAIVEERSLPVGDFHSGGKPF